MVVTVSSAVAGLSRADPRSPGISRAGVAGAFVYRDPAGAQITDPATLQRIRALALPLPPAWRSIWISPDPLGHIQATGVDSRGRTQYRYHQSWREQRDAQKFDHMLRFAGALPALRGATVHDLGRRRLDRDRVAASAVRLIDLGRGPRADGISGRRSLLVPALQSKTLSMSRTRSGCSRSKYAR